MEKKTFTLTFGDRAENHKGMQMIGTEATDGLTYADLCHAKNNFESKGYECEMIILNDHLPTGVKVEDAHILIIRNGTDCLLHHTKTTSDDLFCEQVGLEYDKKAFMHGRVVNKIARYNLCFSDHAQEPDYENGKGRIIAFDDVPLTKNIRKQLGKYIGNKAENLQAEGNYYYDIGKCGIGYHGDSERRIVVGVRLGETIPLCFQWFYKGNAIGKNIKLNLDHGDIYLMSQKATGHDWKLKNEYTLRHAAGCDKYILI